MMQYLTPIRGIIALFFAAILSSCISQPPARLSTPPKPAPQKKAVPATAPIPTDMATPKKDTRFIAVILPQTTPALSLAASTIHNGIETAKKHTPSAIDTRYYYMTDEVSSPVLQYQRATNDGAGVVIGPLTKTAADNLVKNAGISVPILLLNTVTEPASLPDKAYIMALSVEEEARDMAQTIQLDGHLGAIIVYTDSNLSRRIGQAFAVKWRAITDNLPKAAMTDSAAERSALRELIRTESDAGIFLAMTATEAAAIVPELTAGLNTEGRLYGISQIAPENTAQQKTLMGITYADMPMLLNPDNYKLYLHPKVYSLDHERLYALGIDAYVQAVALLKTGQLPLIYDGVAGRWFKTQGQELKRMLPGNQARRKTLMQQSARNHK